MASVALELFSVSFLQTLIHETIDSNIFYSPLSIVAAFSMLLLGTKNNSTNQLVNVLKFNSRSLDDYHDKLSILIEKCITPSNEYDDTVLSIANGLFIQQNFHIKSKFKSGLEKYYKTKMKEVNFGGPVAVQEVNQWIENKTNNKIKDMFSENSLNALTRLVIANAVYFKGNFKDNFLTANTIEKAFHKSATVQKMVKMMQKVNKGHYFAENSELGLKVLSIPFKNKFKFLLLLPTTRFTLDQALMRLKERDFTGLVKSMELRMVSTLEVPQFKINTQMDLKQLMSSLGAVDIFDPSKADLKGISDESLFVDKAIHKTFLDVNEFGVEAAAATGISIGITSVPQYANDTPIEFIVDEPFLVSIYNDETEAIVFLGRINNP